MPPRRAGDRGPRDVDTPSGIARVHVHPAQHGRPRATLVLGHGAGGGVDSPDLVAIATALPELGVEVVLVEQPWRVQGRRVAGPPRTLDAAWVACLADLRSRGMGARRLVVGGRSAGARVACRTVEEVRPDALLLLAFPLWPARRPSVREVPDRLPELVVAARAVPTVLLQGTEDRLGSPGEIAVGLAEAQAPARVIPIGGVGHSLVGRGLSGRVEQPAIDLVVRAASATALRLLQGGD